MRTSATLSRYIGRQFLLWFCLMLLLFLGIILMLDTIELLRRAGTKPDITFWLILKMALYKLPDVGQQVFPFVVLFSAMYTFWRLTRSAELVVARAVGVSVWQFLTPVVVSAVLIGVLKVTVINPVGAVFLAEYDKLDEIYLRLKSNSMDVSAGGLWLRQSDEDNQFFIHADKVDPNSFELQQVSVFHFDRNGAFLDRIEAPKAMLAPREWRLVDAVQYFGKGKVERIGNRVVPTELDRSTIEESFAEPGSISFWALPHFINTLEATGFPAVRHRLYLQSLLSQPVLFCAMVLFAAAFSLRMPRRGGALLVLTGGVMTGFVIFVFTDVIRTLGLSGTIPVPLAAWSPAGVAVMLGIALLLHLEDG
jgi:lipopolysaccharide export system permease protein